MFLKKISIINYKNIREATLELSPRLNCLIGNNGQGKTNFLDAVYYLSFCRSATNPIDSQVITHNQDFFVLEGEYAQDPLNSLNPLNPLNSQPSPDSSDYLPIGDLYRDAFNQYLNSKFLGK